MRFLAGIIVVAACHAQAVTATQTVRVSIGGNKTEVLRKINGRWWTQDNRQVYPPGKGGIFWEIDSKPGVVEFRHYRPFDLAKAELLHLFETRAEVETALGEPNRIFGSDDHAMWYYYAADGTIVWLRFMGEDGLGEADYEPVNGEKRSVESLARELGGRSIYKVMAERATQRSHDRQARNAAELRASVPHRGRSTSPQVTTVAAPVFEPAKPEENRIVSRADLSKIKLGAARSDVFAALGEPSTRTSINGGEELRETLTYHLTDGTPVEIRLIDGKVTKLPF